ncbi:conserved hypothetical protein [delta proteobacterium NaphS2]|nr:conserved hypothetical protein [delta proteobacterium NaphS2]
MKMTDNPLIIAANQLNKTVAGFKVLAREYYFDVILSVHFCPECGGRIVMTGSSECRCECGNVFDPTLAFQKSTCCERRLRRKTLHYVCSDCGNVVPSLFLFNERLFDKAYFREMAGKSRARAARQKQEMGRILAESRSDVLLLTDEPRLKSITGLLEDLDDFIGTPAPEPDFLRLDSDSVFRMADYRTHILHVVGDDCLMFSDIGPLVDDLRRDRVWRFITLIFMQNDREVMLTQYGNDFLVEAAR